MPEVIDHTVALAVTPDEEGEIARLAGEVAERYLLCRAAPSAGQRRAAEELRSALAFVDQLRDRLGAAPVPVP